MTRVDIVIPTRNRYELTLEAARSVQHQTMTDWHLRIVDDGSDDSSAERLADTLADDSRISILQSSGTGPETARQTGVAAGQAPWVALLDSDDLWLPGKLEKQLAAARDGVDVVLTWYEWFRPDGSVRKVGRISGSGTVSPLLTDNMSMPLIKRETLARIGGVGPQDALGGLPGTEGIEFFLRLLREGHVAVVPEVLVRCRDHGGSRESSHLQSLAGARALSRTIDHHRGWLREWPREYALLSARGGARFAVAGDVVNGARLIVGACRVAPTDLRWDLCKKYGPFLAKQGALNAIRSLRSLVGG